MGKWYDKGRSEALAGLPSDPPWQPGHRDYTAYLEGYADGEREAWQEAIAEEAAGAVKVYYCGICDHFHRVGFAGDCRDDSERFTLDRLDSEFGREGQGWIEEED